MSVLVDTGVLYAWLNDAEADHATARRLMERIGRGEFGAPVITEHIIDELFTLIRARKQSPAMEASARAALPIDGPSKWRLRVAMVGEAGLLDAMGFYARHRDRGLSFTDATHLAIMRRLEIRYLATLEGGFQGLVPTVP